MARENKMYIVLGAVLLLASCTSAAAPGDEDDRCQKGSFAHPYEEGVRALMDTYNYEQLLGVSGAVWDQTDFDNNNDAQFFFIQTHWQHSVGGICKWSIQSCGSSEGTQENWAFTQYISKDAPAGTNYDVEVCVNVTHRISNCRERNRCNPEFEVYKYVTSGPQSTSNVRNRDNYERVLHRRVEVAATLTDQMCFTLRDQDKGFYIGLRDPNSCVLVSRVIAYRHECDARQVGLVSFPATASPTEGSRSLSAQCVANAEPVSSMRVQCRSDGIWVGTPQCRCKAGYKQETDGEGNLRCVACPAGTYRSASDPQSRCLSCPSNTARDQVAATQCECLTNYFRNTAGTRDACPRSQSSEGPSTPCTQPPSKPTRLTQTSVTENRVSVSWGRPSSLGGRTDLYYTVEYSDPDNVGQFIKASGSSCVTSLSYTITGLRPATDYLVRVMAHNGVSDQDQNGALGRLIEMAVTTSHAAPSAPQNIRGFCNVIVWEEPASPNGVLTGYEIMFYPQNNPSGITPRMLNNPKTFYITNNGDISQGPGSAYVRVRAVNDAGVSSWSSSVSVGCGNNCPSISSSTPPAAINTPPPNTGAVTLPGVVQDIQVLGCGTVAWKPPANTGGDTPGYVIRFFNGNSYGTSSYREIQRYFDDPERRWAKANNLPSTRPIYADIRARNSAGVSPFTPRFVVANDTLCPSSSSSSSSSTPVTVQCPVCPVNTPVEEPSCPTPPACDSCCPSCPAPEPCPETNTGSNVGGIATRIPGTVRNVRALNCTTIVWEAPEDDGGDIEEYRVRLYSGSSYSSTSSSERMVIISTDLWAIPQRLPSRRPVRAVVKARNSVGFSQNWSEEVILTDSSSCPCSS